MKKGFKKVESEFAQNYERAAEKEAELKARFPGCIIRHSTFNFSNGEKLIKITAFTYAKTK